MVRELMKPLDVYLQEPGVNEVAVNEPGSVWIKTFSGWRQESVPALTFAYLESLSTAICVYNGVDFLETNSVQLINGERVEINRPPVTLDGHITLSIRTHSSTVKTVEELASEGSFDLARDVSFNKPDEAEIQRYLSAHDFTRLEPFEAELLRLKHERKWAEFLSLAVEARRNIVVSGATGSGKTTFVRSLIEKVPFSERIITFEDVHELKLNHPNKVHMIFGEGKGRVSPKRCLKSAMRMSPDRIFPAEIRSGEAWEYLSSLNTGHPGSATTTHANSAIETFGRIFALVKESPAGGGLDSTFIMNEIYKTVNIALFFHKRKLIEVFYDPIFSKSKLA